MEKGYVVLGTLEGSVMEMANPSPILGDTHSTHYVTKSIKRRVQSEARVGWHTGMSQDLTR